MFKEVVIRDIKTEDFNSLTYLIEALGYASSTDDVVERLNKISAEGTYKTFVAEINDKIVGFIGVHKLYVYEANGFFASIMALIVDEKYREKGIGTKLINEAENWAKLEGAVDIVLSSGLKRIEAHKFYKNKGYNITDYSFRKSVRTQV